MEQGLEVDNSQSAQDVDGMQQELSDLKKAAAGAPSHKDTLHIKALHNKDTLHIKHCIIRTRCI